MKIKYYPSQAIDDLVKDISLKNDASYEDSSLSILSIDKISCSNNATEISGETSNEIEGISLKYSTNAQMVKKINDNYNQILNKIKYKTKDIDFSLNTILLWHKQLFNGVEIDKRLHTGVWKQGQNYVNQEPMASVIATPILMNELMLWWKQEESLHPLIKIPLFIINFLRIHPFEDGNGRMSRLITNYLLIANHYDIAKYISIESYMLKHKQAYFAAIRSSTKGWDEETNNAQDFIKFNLDMLEDCFKAWMNNLEFHHLIQSRKLKKRDVVLMIINDLIENNIPVTKSSIKDSIRARNVDISEDNIKDALKSFSTQGLLLFRRTKSFSYYECDHKKIQNKIKQLMN